jgi:hypothetical protein
MSNGFDEQGKYNPNVFVPGAANVMSRGERLVSEGNGLQRFITSPVNQQPSSKESGTLSIKQAYLHRFGNNTANATLPTTQ